MDPRIDPVTGKRYQLDYNQIYHDPNTGEEVGGSYWGAVWPLKRENFVSLLYKLHYTMHIAEFWGSERWGMRLLGVIAIDLDDRLLHRLLPDAPIETARERGAAGSGGASD